MLFQAHARDSRARGHAAGQGAGRTYIDSRTYPRDASQRCVTRVTFRVAVAPIRPTSDVRRRDSEPSLHRSANRRRSPVVARACSCGLRSPCSVRFTSRAARSHTRRTRSSTFTGAAWLTHKIVKGAARLLLSSPPFPAPYPLRGTNRSFFPIPHAFRAPHAPSVPAGNTHHAFDAP